MKLLLFVIFSCLAARVLTGRWPWEWSGASARSKKLNSARALLGLGKNAGREEIIEAHRKLVVMVHPDRGGTNEQVYEANAARDVLLEEAVRHISE